MDFCVLQGIDLSVFVWSRARRKPSPSSGTTDREEEESEDDEYVERESGRRKEDALKMERWVLDVTHSIASFSASETLLQGGRHTHKGGVAAMEQPEKRLRSVITISS